MVGDKPVGEVSKTIADKEIHGFYYDSQMADETLTVTLHSNMTYNNGVWEEFKGEGMEKLRTDAAGHNVYNPVPIARSLLSEDFQIDISNNWSEVNGDDMISSVWNNIRSYGPMIKFIGDKAEKIKNQVDEVDGLGSTVNRWLGNAAGWVKKYGDIASKNMARSMYTQGTKFTYYAGTSTSFGNLVMKYTVFADWDEKGENFLTVSDQLSKLLPYVSGKFDGVTGKGSNQIDTGNDTLNEAISEFIGWQSPPGGYEPDIKNVDVCFQGTLRLRLGGYYNIDNLICRGCNINLSKTMTKNPKNPSQLVPLYAEVTISLQPAGIYTNESLMRFINCTGSEKLMNEVANKNKEQLDKESKKINEAVSTTSSGSTGESTTNT
jgi:hypothetical protein